MPEVSSHHNPHEDNFHIILDDLYHEFLKSPSTKCNYFIRPVWTNGPDSLDLHLDSKIDDTVYSLGHLLPEGWKFKSAGYLSADHVFKSVKLDATRLRNKGFILCVLHEIAHARQGFDVKPIFQDVQKNMFKRIKFALSTSTRAFVIEYRKQMALSKDKFDPSLYCFLETMFPKNIRDQYFQIIAESERNAWADALLMAKDLERKGLNVLGEFESSEEVYNLISYCLSTYEFAYYSSQKIFGTPDSFQKPFVKTRKLTF